MSKPLVIVNCSSRKRTAPRDELQARNLAAGPADEVASVWSACLERAETVLPAAELYCGRNFAEARKAASDCCASLYILSAGLGLVHADDRIPSYDLTVTPGSPDCIFSRIVHPCSAQEWWDVGAARSPFSRGLSATVEGRGPAERLVLLALPGNYLRMVEHELLRLPERLLSRVRLFSGAADVALPLRRVLMPYDGRLNGGNSALPGTGTDFAARALADFTRWILPELPDADLEAHRGAVVRRLSSWAYNSRLIRERHTDEQLSALITEHWNEAGRSASRMLRYFRDELGIACEQARFSRLFARAQGGVETAP